MASPLIFCGWRGRDARCRILPIVVAVMMEYIAEGPRGGRHPSQKERVKTHLLTIGPLTPLEALRLYGSFRLGAIIHVLREKEGENIMTRMVKTPGGALVAEYYYTSRPFRQLDLDL